MQQHAGLKWLHIPQFLLLSLLLAVTLTFTACDGNNGEIEEDGIEEGVGGEDADDDGDDLDDDSADDDSADDEDN